MSVPAADLIKTRLVRREESLRSIASKLGVDVAHLSRVLAGAKPASPALIVRAADLLEFAPEDCSEYRRAVVRLAVGRDTAALDAVFERVRRDHPALYEEAVKALRGAEQ